MTDYKSVLLQLQIKQKGCQIAAFSITIILSQNQPTLPSNEISSSFCASTANSIGNWFKTSFT